MRHVIKVFIGFATVTLMLIGLAGCGGANNSNSTNSDDSLVLHVYTVPEGRAKNLRSALQNVFYTSKGQKAIGRVSATGPSQVLVLAPRQMQASIGASIKKIVGNQPQASKPSSPLQLSAWTVDAFPGQGPSDPALKAIQPALKAFSAATNPAHFVQAHYLTAVSDIGYRTVLNPRNGYRFTYTINQSSGGYVLQFKYRQCAVGLQGQTTVQRGQTLVLGLISDRPAKYVRAPCGADQTTTIPATESTSAGQHADQVEGQIRRLLVVRIAPAKSS
jgi:hypothetical protein